MTSLLTPLSELPEERKTQANKGKGDGRSEGELPGVDPYMLEALTFWGSRGGRCCKLTQ